MSESPAAAWFYTKDGEKIGPVTFADLRIKATEGGLNPRLDMVWSQGMDNWKPSGAIEGLFERKEAPKPVEIAPPADSYRPPMEESVADVMSHQGDWPGARRRSFLFMVILFPALWAFGLKEGAPYLQQQAGDLTPKILLGLQCLPILTTFYFAIRRLINLGMSGGWILGYIVPFLNLWLGYRSFSCPPGYAYHKKMDGIGVFLAILYWLMLLAVIVATAGAIAIMAGAAGDPELRRKVHEAWEAMLRNLPHEAGPPPSPL